MIALFSSIMNGLSSLTAWMLAWLEYWLDVARLGLSGVPVISIVPGLAGLMSAMFLFRPLVLLLVLGLASGRISVLVNLRKIEFHAETLVHAVFPGIVVGVICAGLNGIVPGGIMVAFIVALVLAYAPLRGSANESACAMVLTVFFAIGMIISLRFGDRSGQLEALMFGRLLSLTAERFWQTIVLCMVAGVCALMHWRKQVTVAFDPLSAASSGIAVRRLDVELNIALACLVVAASSAIGVLLAVGYVIIPGAIARLLAWTYRSMVPIAVITGCLGGYVGLSASTMPSPRPLSAQACVALSLVALFLSAALVCQVIVIMQVRTRNMVTRCSIRSDQACTTTQRELVHDSADHEQLHGRASHGNGSITHAASRGAS